MSQASVAVAAGDRRARKNVYLLAAAQALYGANATMVMTLGGVIGHQLASDKSLATAPITTYVLGTALTTVPASLLMRRVGRRVGFMTGAGFAFAGAALAVHAIYAQSFLLFCLATLLSGAYQAFAQYYRFAAADTASEAFKAKAISWVLVGGVVAAFTGPQIVIWSKELLSPVLFAGTFLCAAGLAVTAAAVVNFIDIPVPPHGPGFGSGRPLAQIVLRPRFIVAAACGMASYAIMSLVMTASPLAMLACDHTIDDAAFVVQWHAVAMFAPSFVTGHLIARFGKAPMIATGMLLLAGCGLVAMSGQGIVHFWVALVLLGVGWNFGFVAATAMVTDCHRPEERNKVQAANDFLVFGLVATASFSSGKLLDAFGWDAVNLGIFPLAVFCIALLMWLVRTESGKAAA